MPQVKCPRCGKTTDTHAADYPFCSSCQENLAKCGYCRSFESASETCCHPYVAGIFEVSSSATPPCVYHDPADWMLQRRRHLQVAAWLAGVVLLVSVAYGLLQLRMPAQSFLLQHDLMLAAEADYTGATVGQPYAVVVVLRNITETTASGVRLELSKLTLAGFDLVSVDPPAGAIEDRDKWEIISHPTLRAGETRRVVIILQPKHAGTLHVRVRLVSGGNIFHGLADLPVLVEAAANDTAPAVGTSGLGEE